MELRPCGRSSLNLSALGVGCWAFGGGAYWGDARQQDVDAVTKPVLDRLGNSFDYYESFENNRTR